jgi:hypothetical protein
MEDAMKRWIPKTSFPVAERWQSRAEILKAHLDRLSPDELFDVRPSYYWQRFGFPAWQREYARKYDPDQPRDDQGRWVDAGGDRQTSETDDEGTTDNPVVSFAAARRRGRSMAYCMAQYAVDGLMCNSAERSRQRACWTQAGERLANCLSGRPIPPLNF